LVAFLALAVLTGRAAYIAAFQHGDEPVELLVYTQTSRHLPNIAHRIGEMAQNSGQGRAMRVTVDATSGFSWPWAWYLRNYTNVGYPGSLGADSLPAELPPALLVHLSTALSVEPRLAGYSGERYPLRQWFPEGYRDMTRSFVA
jgi:hypothetical protein